jgi:hypothetical protein
MHTIESADISCSKKVAGIAFYYSSLSCANEPTAYNFWFEFSGSENFDDSLHVTIVCT